MLQTTFDAFFQVYFPQKFLGFCKVEVQQDSCLACKGFSVIVDRSLN